MFLSGFQVIELDEEVYNKMLKEDFQSGKDMPFLNFQPYGYNRFTVNLIWCD